MIAIDAGAIVSIILGTLGLMKFCYDHQQLVIRRKKIRFEPVKMRLSDLF